MAPMAPEGKARIGDKWAAYHLTDIRVIFYKQSAWPHTQEHRRKKKKKKRLVTEASGKSRTLFHTFSHGSSAFSLHLKERGQRTPLFTDVDPLSTEPGQGCLSLSFSVLKHHNKTHTPKKPKTNTIKYPSFQSHHSKT